MAFSLSCGRWESLPNELKLGCLRPLRVEDALTFACASREAGRVAQCEELWLDLYQRDWRWLCPNGPLRESSHRRQHLWISRQAREHRSVFVVLGGAVCRDRPGGLESGHAHGHADVTVLSTLSMGSGQSGEPPAWKSFSLPSVQGRCAAGICHGKERLYIAGGFDFSSEAASSASEALDVPSLLQGMPRAEALPPLARARACPAVVATREAVLAIGGGSSMFTGAEVFSSVEALPLNGRSSEESAARGWQPAVPLMRPRCAAGSCATASGQVFVVGGYAGKNVYEDTVEWIDASCGEGLLRGWQSAPALGHARAGCVASFGPDGCVWVVGGGCDGEESLATLERLDPRAPRWCGDVPPMPGRRRCFAGGFGVDGQLYIYGGWTSTRWHDPTAARLDLRAMRWEKLPVLYGDAGGIIPYHFVSGCVAL